MQLQKIRCNTIIRVAVIMGLVGAMYTANASIQQHKIAIMSVIKSYEQALNNGDVDNIIRLYSKDGVFMPSGKPSSVGKAQVTMAYRQVFKELDLNVEFHFNEFVWRDDIAVVRTVSDGQIKLIDKNMTLDNHSRELFIMKRINGDWKIYRYMFNETSRP